MNTHKDTPRSRGAEVNRRMIGLAATLGILLMVVGIPAGLFVAAGSPVPGGVPDLGAIGDALTRPDDGTMFLAGLKVIGWLAWASFATMVVLEIVSRLRGVQAPSIPALGLQQRAAAGLVGAAVLLFAASPLLGASPAAAAEPTPAHHTAHHATTTAAQAPQATPVVEQARGEVQEKAQAQTREYVVQPGDSLYSIAEQLLGDGARFGEIAQLNYGVTQADGQQLTSSHWIQPGWKLTVPAALGAQVEAGHVVVEPGDTLSEIAQETLGDGNRYPELFEATRGTEQPGGAHLTDPDLIHPGWTITVPGQGNAPGEEQTPGTVERPAPSTQQAPENVQPPTTEQGGGKAEQPAPEAEVPDSVNPESEQQKPAADQLDEVDVDDEDGFPVRTAAGVGSLLAAGLLTLIAARRARQQRRRRPGQDIPMPTGDALEVEEELRLLADPMSVETVDLALRTLSAQCAAQSQPLPKVRAARLTADQFDLYLAEPAQLPAPWDGTADGTVWTLSGETEDLIHAEDVEDVPAPYPALVTIGHDDEDGHVFVDLEYLGALGVIGDAEQTPQVMAALAVELATSRWADDLQVTIVGAYAELEDSLETGRVRYVPSAGRLLEELQHRAEQDRHALAETGAGDLNHARVQNAVPGAWTPEIVLFTGDMTNSQRDLLKALVEELPRVAIAAVTSGEAVGEWALRITGEQIGVLEPFGLSVRPQLLDDDTYAQVLMVLATTDDDDETEHPEWADHTEPTLADLEAIVTAAGHVDDEEPVAVVVDEVGDAAAEVDNASAAEADADADADDVQVAVDDEEQQQHEHQQADEHEQDEEHQQEEPAQEVFAALHEDQAPADADVDEQVALEPRPQGDLDETGAEADAPSAPAAALEVESVPDTSQEDTADVRTEAEVALMPRRGPQILLMGPVELVDATGPVEPSKKARLTELAAIIATHPGCDHTTIDACYSPGKRSTDNARNTQMSKLRRWLGKTAEGDDFLPRFQASTGYRFLDQVTSDWGLWNELLPDGPATASTEALEEALKLVRDKPPFSGVRARHYAWSETLKQQMIRAIVDASYELARRRLMDGHWRRAEDATLVGLAIEPGMETLWRVRILAAHARGNATAVQEAVDRLLAIADDWGGELETETEELLEHLNNGTTPSRTLAASAH